MSDFHNVNMASDADEFDKNIENLKATVRESFTRIYATLKARELKTLRQLDAIRKQCQDDKGSMRNCIQDLQLCFSNESSLLDNISNYGAIDFEKLKFDSKTFTLEEYVSPEDDHMYSYKTIEELTKDVPEEIEEAALRQITATEDCVCFVNINPQDVSKQFRETDPPFSPMRVSFACSNAIESKEVDCPENVEEEKSIEEKSFSSESEPDVKKIEPTDDWLNSIKNQTETEPSQITDGMEHSTITCS